MHIGHTAIESEEFRKLSQKSALILYILDIDTLFAPDQGVLGDPKDWCTRGPEEDEHQHGQVGMLEMIPPLLKPRKHY